MHALWKHFGSQFLKPLGGEKNGTAGTQESEQLTRTVRSYKNQHHVGLCVTRFNLTISQKAWSVGASVISLPSLACSVWWVNWLLLGASHPSSFGGTLRCNNTQRQNKVQVSLRRAKLPFTAVKTRAASCKQTRDRVSWYSSALHCCSAFPLWGDHHPL